MIGFGASESKNDSNMLKLVEDIQMFSFKVE